MLNFYHVVSCCVGAAYLIGLMVDDCKDKMILTRCEYMVEEIRGEKVIKEVPCPIVANVFTHELLEVKRDCLCCYCHCCHCHHCHHCLLFVACCLLSVVCWLLVVVCSLFFVGCWLWVVVCWLLFVLCSLLVVGCCLLVVVCYM